MDTAPIPTTGSFSAAVGALAAPFSFWRIAYLAVVLSKPAVVVVEVVASDTVPPKMLVAGAVVGGSACGCATYPALISPCPLQQERWGYASIRRSAPRLPAMAR